MSGCKWLFCRHKWEVKVDKVIESQFEEIMKKGLTKFKVGHGGIPEEFFQRTHICIMVCTLCGDVSKTITRI